MSLESVRAFFAAKAPDIAVIESSVSSATVALAAEAYGVEPARMGKVFQRWTGWLRERPETLDYLARPKGSRARRQ